MWVCVFFGKPFLVGFERSIQNATFCLFVLGGSRFCLALPTYGSVILLETRFGWVCEEHTRNTCLVLFLSFFFFWGGGGNIRV